MVCDAITNRDVDGRNAEVAVEGSSTDAGNVITNRDVPVRLGNFEPEKGEFDAVISIVMLVMPVQFEKVFGLDGGDVIRDRDARQVSAV